MLNFNLHTTTEVVFGKDIEEQIGPPYSGVTCGN